MSSLKKLAILSTGTMKVRDAAGETVNDDVTGLPWGITVHSPGTKEYSKAKHAFDTKRSNSITAMMTGSADAKRSAEDELRETAEFLAAVTISFDNFDYEGRKGFEAHKAAYMDLEIGHVANDLNKYLGERGNFLPPKKGDSSSTSDTLPG